MTLPIQLINPDYDLTKPLSRICAVTWLDLPKQIREEILMAYEQGLAEGRKVPTSPQIQGVAHLE